MTVDKTRQAWTLPDVEIVLDHVVDAGDFVEFEFKGDAADVRNTTERLDAFIVASPSSSGSRSARATRTSFSAATTDRLLLRDVW
ncbi:CYTH domain-containing protein [Micromonospora sp. NPDC052213]|uniref:CYTH domain-containing protein n=1 Tax=Micromonospora sp. NPDC052213 TaxID=3155812 RepID=UPI003422D237